MEIFECTQCGDCCRGYGGTYVSAGEVRAIGDQLGLSPAQVLDRFCSQSGHRPLLAQGDDGFCVFFKDGLCGIHAVKPRMCRAWPYIEAVCVDVRNWHSMADSCPGMRTDIADERILAEVRCRINRRCDDAIDQPD